VSSCCETPTKEPSAITNCPICRQKGKRVQLITLKSLLEPSALETIHPESSYAFCPTASCAVVYFSDLQTYEREMLKVSVFQKDNAVDVPVCYCFGWTRKRLVQAIQSNQRPIEMIREQVEANRCGCEVNNPQGACCLGNVTTFVRGLEKNQGKK